MLTPHRGLHGYTHEHVGTLSEQQQKDILTKSIDVITKFTRRKPKGWTAPAWNTSKETVHLLEEFGIVRFALFRPVLFANHRIQEYDHSFMHHDSQLYYCPYSDTKWKETNVNEPASSWMTPMSSLAPSGIVEVPANWHLDDWLPFNLSLKQASTHGYVDTRSVEQLWKDQFDYLYAEHETFVFPMSIHPQVSGKPQVILMHQRLFEYINAHEGVEWVTMEEMVREFKEGRFGGVEVEGGVD